MVLGGTRYNLPLYIVSIACRPHWVWEGWSGGQNSTIRSVNGNYKILGQWAGKQNTVFWKLFTFYNKRMVWEFMWMDWIIQSVAFAQSAVLHATARGRKDWKKYNAHLWVAGIWMPDVSLQIESSGKTHYHSLVPRKSRIQEKIDSIM